MKMWVTVLLLQGFKVGLCSQAPLDVQHSLLCLANNCCISNTFNAMLKRFDQLFSRGVYVHHYSQFMDAQDMVEARTTVLDVTRAYEKLDGQERPSQSNNFVPQGLLAGGV